MDQLCPLRLHYTLGWSYRGRMPFFEDQWKYIYRGNQRYQIHSFQISPNTECEVDIAVRSHDTGRIYLHGGEPLEKAVTCWIKGFEKVVFRFAAVHLSDEGTQSDKLHGIRFLTTAQRQQKVPCIRTTEGSGSNGFIGRMTLPIKSAIGESLWKTDLKCTKTF